MSRRINPIIFRFGITNLWNSRYNVLNYITHLKNFLIFKFYINSKLTLLNQIFFTNYYNSNQGISANIISLFKPSYIYKYLRRDYVSREYRYRILFKVKKTKIFYNVFRFFSIIYYLKYLVYYFIKSTKTFSLLRLYYFYWYKVFNYSLFQELRSTKFKKSSMYLVYFIQYIVYFNVFDCWFQFFKQKISISSRYKKQKSYFRLRKYFGNNINFFQVPKNYVKFMVKFKDKGSSIFFIKFFEHFVFGYIQWYKTMLLFILFRFYNYWVFIKYFYFKFILKAYLTSRYSEKLVKLNFNNIYFFSKNFKKLFYALPSIVSRSFREYKVSFANKQKILFIFLIALVFKNIKLFNILVSYLLPRHRNQYGVMRLLEYIIGSFELFQFNFYTIIIKISGKFSGRFVKHKPKRKIMTIIFGNEDGMPLQTLSIKCDYSSIQVNTRKGIFGVKTWFYLKN